MLLISVLLLVAVARQHLGPGFLGPWRQAVSSSALRVSSGIAGDTGVEITLEMNAPTNITDGVVKVTFPEGFSLQDVKTDSGEWSVDGSVVAIKMREIGGDMRIRLCDVKNPLKSGSYAPLGVATGRCRNCTTTDENSSFGFFYITEPMDIWNLKVRHDSTTDPTTVDLGSDVTMKVTYTTVSGMFAGDGIAIRISEGWIVMDKALCTLVVEENKMQSTVCGGMDNHTATLFGVQEDVSAGSSIAIFISGIRTPFSITPPESIVWNVFCFQSQLTLVKERGSFHGEIILRGGAFKSVVWAPTDSSVPLVSGMWRYMDLTFNTRHPIPKGGFLLVVLPGSRQSLYPGPCFLVTPSNSTAVCSDFDPKTLKISSLPEIPADSEVRIRTYSQVMQWPSMPVLVNISSYSTLADYHMSLFIDKVEQFAALTLSKASASSLIQMEVTFGERDEEGTDSLNFVGATAEHMAVFVALDFDPYLLHKGNLIKLTCPWSVSPSDSQIQIDENLEVYWSELYDFSDAIQAKATLTNSTLTVELNNNAPKDTQIVLRVSTSGSVPISVPRAASSADTVYECLAAIEGSAHVGATRFEMNPGVWPGQLVTQCVQKDAGAPVVFSLGRLPQVRPGTQFTLQLRITNSGGTPGKIASYPHSVYPGTDSGFTFDSDSVFTLTGLTNASEYLAFPLPKLSVNGAVLWEVTLFLQKGTSQQAVQRSLSGLSMSFSGSEAFTAGDFTAHSLVNGEASNFNFAYQLDSNEEKGIWYVVFPDGADWTSGKASTLTSSVGFYYGSEELGISAGAAWLALTTPSNGGFIVQGLQPPLGKRSFNVGMGFARLGDVCSPSRYYNAQLSVDKGVLGITINHTDISRKRSPACHLSFSVTLTHGTEPNSVLSFVHMEAYWKKSKVLYCTAEIASDSKLPCAYSDSLGFTVTLSKRMKPGVILNITVGPFLVPISPNRYPFFQSIQSQIFHGEVIDGYPNTASELITISA